MSQTGGFPRDPGQRLASGRNRQHNRRWARRSTGCSAGLLRACIRTAITRRRRSIRAATRTLALAAGASSDTRRSGLAGTADQGDGDRTSTVAPGLKVGPFSSFANIGYYQNRLNPSTQRDLRVGQAHDSGGRRLQLYAAEHRQQSRRDRAGHRAELPEFLAGSVHKARTCWRASIRRAERTSRTAITGPTRCRASCRTSGRRCRI